MVSFSLHLIPLLTLPRYGKVKTMGVDCTGKLYTFVRPCMVASDKWYHLGKQTCILFDNRKSSGSAIFVRKPFVVIK